MGRISFIFSEVLLKIITTTTCQAGTTTKPWPKPIHIAEKIFPRATCPPSGCDVAAQECRDEGKITTRSEKTSGTNRPARKERESTEDGGDVCLHYRTYLSVDLWLLSGCSFDVGVLPLFR